MEKVYLIALLLFSSLNTKPSNGELGINLLSLPFWKEKMNCRIEKRKEKLNALQSYRIVIRDRNFIIEYSKNDIGTYLLLK
jgi:hypothetical protein